MQKNAEGFPKELEHLGVTLAGASTTVGIVAWPSGAYQGELDMKVMKQSKMATETKKCRGIKLNTCPQKDIFRTSKLNFK